MNKQEVIRIFEEVLKSWEMAQGCVIQESYVSDQDYDFDDLELDVENYRREFLSALDD